MKRTIPKILLILNTTVWTIISIINYIGIMNQIEDVMQIFLWSIFILMMYWLIGYASSMLIKRLYYIHRNNENVRYNSQLLIIKPMFLLFAVVIYLYGACYLNSNLLGLLPMFLFFGKILIPSGLIYVQREDTFYVLDHHAKEYIVQNINLEKRVLILQEMNPNRQIETQLPLSEHDLSFLQNLLIKNVEVKEVA
ncbi:hypothetical protein H0486_17800 [Lachnospiraceae bacterium MD1]|jgi:hypothetical protein|uniref:Uncharacterized protein n=1 Tax=Variimorphobacter saccharofermentans TaxID=2755051 RepID=A0A839K4D0_9FIRM|nr:hypothetical protein [Variimorphobacter saccharofermentans]MBB2184724.1 hypothetical protein [Variimorphobacter saccharofermentans]